MPVEVGARESVARGGGSPSADTSLRRSVVCNEGERSESTTELRESKPGRALSTRSCACAGPDRVAQHTSATITSHCIAAVPRTGGGDLARLCIASPIMGMIRKKSVRERQTDAQNNSNCSQRSDQVQHCSRKDQVEGAGRAITPGDRYTETVQGTGTA